MESFAGKLAVVTGGGSGMGRELVLKLSAEGCSVAACDLNAESIAETVTIAEGRADSGALVTGHACDVSDEAQVLRFRDEVCDRHASSHVDLVFNNAGIGGGGSFILDRREVWERTFAIDWWGVYYCTRAFMPLLMESDDSLLVNTSSINAYWPISAPGIPLSAYATAKAAVKAFSEALIEDLRVNAPQVKVAMVMPGYIGTRFLANSSLALGMPDPNKVTDADLEAARTEFKEDLLRFGVPLDISPEDLRRVMKQPDEDFRKHAPMDAAEAAASIIDSIRAGEWRILVGEDAKEIDARVRANPAVIYDHADPGTVGDTGNGQGTADETETVSAI